MAGNTTNGWLGERQKTSVGEVAYGVFGEEGSPVVLVHGTPSRSYIWRDIVAALADRHRVYVYDLLGFGESERGEGVDVSIAAQGRALAELVEAWGLEGPAVAGHDIGGAVVLRAHLVEGKPFERIALLDALVLTPWQTPAVAHVREYLDCYRSMPEGVFEDYVASRLRKTTSRPMDEGAFEAYLSQWRGEEGRRAYIAKDLALDERDAAEVEPLMGSIGAPVLLVWGEEDGMVDPSQAEGLREKIPGVEVEYIPQTGHFVQEDAPGEVARILNGFLSEDGEGTTS